jgi:hypothetical protein
VKPGAAPAERPAGRAAATMTGPAPREVITDEVLAFPRGSAVPGVVAHQRHG